MRSPYLQGYASRFKGIQRPSIPSTTLLWESWNDHEILRAWASVGRSLFLTQAIVQIISKIWISWRKQLVQDYEILLSNKINIVVEKKGRTKLFKTCHNTTDRNCIRNWEWRRLVKTASVLTKLKFGGKATTSDPGFRGSGGSIVLEVSRA